MVPPHVAIEPRCALDRPCGALIERNVLRQDARRDQPVEMAVGVLQHRGIDRGLRAQALQFAAQPRSRIEVATQAAGHQQTAQEAASGQLPVDLLGALLEQLALGLADLERGRAREMAKIVEMVIEPLELREERAQHAGALRHVTERGLFDRLAESESVGEAPDPGDPLRENGRVRERAALEALLHAAMLEEQLRMEMQDVLADIEENELHRFDHVGADRSERQPLHVRALDLRQRALGGLERQNRVGRIVRIQGRPHRPHAVLEDEAPGFGMALEFQPVEVRDLALVPAKERTDRGGAGHGALRHASPHEEIFTLSAASDIAQLEPARRRIPRISHLHAAAAADKRADRLGQALGLNRDELDRRYRARRADRHGSPGDKDCAADVK